MDTTCCIQEPASLALVLWFGLGTASLMVALICSVWLDLSGGVIPRCCALSTPVAFAYFFNTGWIILWVLMHSAGVATAADGYVLPWFVLQLAVVPMLPWLAGKFFRIITPRPMLLSSSLAMVAVLLSFVLTTLITPVFNRAGDGVRILIRLVVLPVAFETAAFCTRFTAQTLLQGDVPGASRGFLLLPLALGNAFIGRYYSTGLNSATLSHALSFAVAVLEITMRYTIPVRDRYMQKCLRSVTPRRARRCFASGRIGQQAPKYVAWDDLSPTKQHARTTRAHYAFTTIDTIAEDIAMLTLIPVAIFFRLPTRIGGQPLPLGDVLLRVGVQWLLELCTDIGPFLTYAASRAWLQWRGDALYTGLTHSVAQAAAQEAAWEATDMEGTRTASPHNRCSKQKTQHPSIRSGQVQPAPLCAMVPLTADNPGSLGLDNQDSGGMVAASLGTSVSGMSLDGMNACFAMPLSMETCSAGSRCHSEAAATPSSQRQGEPSCPTAQAVAWQTGACRNACPCNMQSSLDSAMQQVRDARAPLLADDADVLWQRLPWGAVRRAMAPGVPKGEWSWLHWFTFRSELLAARMSASWQRRQRGWSIWVLAMACMLLGYSMRVTLNVEEMCPFADAHGKWYWDACSPL